MPRIRNWQSLTLCRPDKKVRYEHIDELFTDVINWKLIETHLPDMMRVVLSIKAGKFTSHGHVEKMSDCIQYCCDRNDCDLAFMVKDTCFSLHCTDDNLCRSKPAKPSPFHPMVAYMTRYKPQLTSKIYNCTNFFFALSK